MAAANTYVSIATQTLGSAAASVTFSSIPSTYTDLVLISTVTTTSGNQTIYANVNSDSATNYSWTRLSGDGSTASSGALSSYTKAFLGGYSTGTSATIPTTSIAHFMNYANTTTYKTILMRYAGARTSDGEVNAAVNLWRSTSAITTINVSCGATTFVSGSTFSLYGILAA